MKISVLIVTWGDESWWNLALTRAAPSVDGQGAHEVIVSHVPEKTVASARNAIVKRATGDWFIFLDADDEMCPGYLDAMRDAELRSRNLDCPRLLTPAVSQVRGGRKSRPFFYPESDFRTGNWIVATTTVPRDLFESVGGYHEFPLGLEDWNLWARCVQVGAQVVKVPDAILRTYYNPNSDHHKLARNRKEYMIHYEAARKDAWG